MEPTRDDILKPFHILIGIAYLGYSNPKLNPEEKKNYQDLLDALVKEYWEKIKILNDEKSLDNINKGS